MKIIDKWWMVDDHVQEYGQTNEYNLGSHDSFDIFCPEGDLYTTSSIECAGIVQNATKVIHLLNWSKFSYASSINLSNDFLESEHIKGAFDSLTYLKELSLQQNSITVIPNNLFESNSMLETV